MDPDQVNINKQCDPLRRETVTLLIYNEICKICRPLYSRENVHVAQLRIFDAAVHRVGLAFQFTAPE